MHEGEIMLQRWIFYWGSVNCKLFALLRKQLGVSLQLSRCSVREMGAPVGDDNKRDVSNPRRFLHENQFRGRIFKRRTIQKIVGKQAFGRQMINRTFGECRGIFCLYSFSSVGYRVCHKPWKRNRGIRGSYIWYFQSESERLRPVTLLASYRLLSKNFSWKSDL